MADRESITGRRSNKLTARQVATALPGKRLGDGGGIYLATSKAGIRKYIFRFVWKGKPTEAGIGGHGTTLAQAREKAADYRKLVAAGINPIAARRAAHTSASNRKTFGQCADALFAAKSSEWPGAKPGQQWRTTLETSAAPLWGVPVDQVDTEAVLGVLQPLWQGIPETASRLRGRIEAVLDYAKAHGWRSGENPSTWRG